MESNVRRDTTNKTKCLFIWRWIRNVHTWQHKAHEIVVVEKEKNATGATAASTRVFKDLFNRSYSIEFVIDDKCSDPLHHAGQACNAV